MTRRSALVILGLLAAATTSTACNAEIRRGIQTTLFEGVPKPGDPQGPKRFKREPRHPAPPKPRPEPEVVETALPAPEPQGPLALKTWNDVVRALPKDPAGGIDWVRALEGKSIEPKPGLDPDAKDEAVFPLEVELTPEAQPLFKVTFPHQAHTEWLGCTNCHTSIFQMQAGADPITMEKIFAGDYCGRCHGKVAFAPATGCPRCHRALAEPDAAKPVVPAPPREPLAAAKLKTWEHAVKALPATADDGVDWVKALADGLIAPRAALDPRASGPPPVDIQVELVPEGQEAFKVVFPHLPHTQWLTCTNCHPGIFQMKKGADPITMEKVFAGEYCGRCHGKVAFAPATACPRCHVSMGGG